MPNDIDSALVQALDRMKAEQGESFYWFNRELADVEPKIAAERAKIERALATIQRAEAKLEKLEAKRSRAMDAKANRSHAAAQGSA